MLEYGMANYKDTILNFLDIETTGLNYRVDKIIEIYITKIINGKVIDTFYAKLNPGFRPDPFILKLTNINYAELKESPAFEEISESLYEFVKDGIVIAHNARFDYSFIKNELKNYGYDINLDYCCTVKLSRFLYPQYQKHKLDNIMERINYKDGDRHTASYDTEVIKAFFYIALKEHGETKFMEGFSNSIKQSAIPQSLVKFDKDNIPESPGIYYFYGEDNYPLYIGMSKNLRRRVHEHFYQDLTNSKDLKINQKLKRIEVTPTAGILGAYIRESIMIKKYQPLFNRQLRRSQNLIKLEQYLDDDGYVCIRINNDMNFNVYQLENLIGVYNNKPDMQSKLHDLVKLFGLCPKLLGLEKLGGACFSYQLDQCKGACVHKIQASEYNLLFEKAFRDIKITNWPSKFEITIKEENNGLTEELTFNKWCLVRSNQEDLLVEEVDRYRFDFDVYKILHRYLNANKNSRDVMDRYFDE